MKTNTHTNMTMAHAVEFLRQAVVNFTKSNMRKDYKDLLTNLQVKILFNGRLKTCGGRATKGINGPHIIELNPRVMNNATTEDRFNTVSHELAHCLDFAIRGKSGHDARWASLHTAMGGTASRCHTIPMKGINGRVWYIKCKRTGKEWWVTAKKASLAWAYDDQYIVLHQSDPTLAKYETAI